MKNTEKHDDLLTMAENLIAEKNQTIEELEQKRDEIGEQLENLAEKLKSKDATADFEKFKKTRAEYADLMAFTGLLEKQIAESKQTSTEEKQKVEDLLRQLDHQIAVVSEGTFQKLKKYADEIMNIIETDAGLQAEYNRAFEELKLVYNIQNFNGCIATYSVYRLKGIGDIYTGFERVKQK